MIKAKSS